MKHLLCISLSLIFLSACSLKDDARHDAKITERLTGAIEKATQDSVISTRESVRIAHLMTRHHLFVDKFKGNEEKDFKRLQRQYVNDNLQRRYFDAVFSIIFFEGGEETLAHYQKMTMDVSDNND